MPTNTYVALDKVTVGTATPSITFSSIPATYTDLVIVTEGVESANQYVAIRFNGDTASNYSQTRLFGQGTTATSDRQTSATFGRLSVGNPTNRFAIIASVFNYANATTFKTWLSRTNTANDYVGAIAGLWRATPAAITSITITTTTADNFSVGSTFSLYGIKAQVQPGTAKATGGTITYDNFGRVIHTFTASGTFTPTEAITGVEYLVIAGGAGGGSYYDGGGGGAGGYRSSVLGELSGGGASAETTLSLASGAAQTVTVGGGGNGGPTPPGGNGTNGSNSVFGSITSTGGGYGARFLGGAGVIGGTGGSGGGSSGNSNGTTVAAASGTASQGYAGGTSGAASGGGDAGGSGGGGAGAVGANAAAGNNTNGGAGGTGVSSFINGTATTRGGGGGGGSNNANSASGGAGGGGAGGARNNVGVAATANTGGGGGGAGSASTDPNRRAGGNGGSGIVIVRYQG
jgi:hypothetical protein